LSAGIVTTADTSGVLALQTAGTTAISIGSNQNVNFAGTAQRITGDFSNATLTNRVAFQTSTTNGNTSVAILPNGTGTTAVFNAYGNSDPTNASRLLIGIVTNATADIRSDITGTGTYLPMTFHTGGTESLRLSATTKAVILAGGSTSANGTGITFPATQSASTDVNTLDDYEEGTFTPTLGGTSTYAQQAGSYKKVGGLVYVSGILQVTTLGTGSTSQMSGFPFTCSVGPRNTLAVAYWSSTVGSLAYLAFYVPAGSATSNTIATTAVANTVQDGYGVFQNGTYVIFSGCYHAS